MNSAAESKLQMNQPQQSLDSNNGGGSNNNKNGVPMNNADPNDDAQRGKRRSKNDVEGRDYVCRYCDKTYLSYPALYTHQKQKHSKGPDGEIRAPPSSGRGRGRPRKNPYQRVDPKSEEYFLSQERRGGPQDPILWFKELYAMLLKDKANEMPYSEYPLYKALVQFSR